MQVLYSVAALTVACLALGFWYAWIWWGLVLLGPLAAAGLRDLLQKNHSLLRNYPLIGRLRYLIEGTGAEFRQYIVESNTEGRPFNRDTRSLIYQRSKNVVDKKAFGTEKDVYAETYGWLAHSMVPKPVDPDPVANFRVDVGGPDCLQPYSCSVYNISAMSFGSLSKNAIRALNLGAKKGHFAHNTGEGGFSRHHREGGDIIWQIGTGYFGCRKADGSFDADLFSTQASEAAVKMIEIKLSQGAKPGHGGILPGHKVTPEIAAARKVPVGQECISPAYHTAFSTPTGLCEFVGRLRELSQGKPVGFKLCVGRPEEFFAVCKAMLETGITPDFITVDGCEGGTGAAPIEFCDNIGMPVKEGLTFVNNALIGVGLRDRIRLIASGKIVTAFHMAAAYALGADICNSARGYMFALGCIQAQLCHTNECPVGVATQDPKLVRGLVTEPKSDRVRSFHRNTLHAFAEVIAAAGLTRPDQVVPGMMYQRTSPTDIRSFEDLYERVEPRDLLGDNPDLGRLQPYWDAARADTF
jgi:glutamate synthase domain-containing protein 2